MPEVIKLRIFTYPVFKGGEYRKVVRVCLNLFIVALSVTFTKNNCIHPPAVITAWKHPFLTHSLSSISDKTIQE